MNDREKYVEALNRERGAVASRPDTPERVRRLADIDQVLDRFSDKPAKRHRETAAAAGT